MEYKGKGEHSVGEKFNVKKVPKRHKPTKYKRVPLSKLKEFVSKKVKLNNNPEKILQWI